MQRWNPRINSSEHFVEMVRNSKKGGEEMQIPAKSTKAKSGERMIEVKVRFWTNGIAEGKGWIKPKHAWTRGVVLMKRNQSHGIIPEYPHPFNSLMELLAVIEKVLIQHGVILHLDYKMDKYIIG